VSKPVPQPDSAKLWWAKCIAVGAVGAATSILTVSVDATPLQLFCTAIVGAGAALGIVSGGMGRR
jgi:hypothetical protein